MVAINHISKSEKPIYDEKYLDSTYCQLENAVFDAYRAAIGVINIAKTRYDMGSNASMEVNGNATKCTVLDNKGKVSLKLSYSYENSPNPVGVGFSTMNHKVTIEKPHSLAVFMEQGNYVELSEYMLGVENALSVTRYTPKGKQVFERVDAKASVSGALKPITARDIKIVKRKIRNNIQIIVSPPNRVADYNDLDNFKRILDGKSPQKPQLRF